MTGKKSNPDRLWETGSGVIKKILAPLILMIVLFGCQDYTPQEYMKNIESSNEYEYHDTAGTAYMHVVYRPAEYLALRELMKAGNDFVSITRETFNAQCDDFLQGCYFEVKIGRMGAEKNIVIDGVQSRQAYNNRIHVLSNGLNRRFYIQTDNGEVLYPLQYNFYNSFGMGKTADFTVIFSKKELQDVSNAVFIYEDLVFGINRKLSVEMLLQDISSTPDIQFN